MLVCTPQMALLHACASPVLALFDCCLLAGRIVPENPYVQRTQPCTQAPIPVPETLHQETAKGKEQARAPFAHIIPT